MQDMKTVQLKVPVWLKERELSSFIARLLKERYGYVSIGEIRRRFGVKKLKGRIKISEQEQRQVLELRKKDASRARIA